MLQILRTIKNLNYDHLLVLKSATRFELAYQAFAEPRLNHLATRTT